jgi:ketosteroid isomerase-like protein
MLRDAVTRWLAAYEAAWRTAGTEPLRALFTDDASYRMSPYEEPVVGLPAIAELWEAERDGPDESFTMEHEIVAVDGDTAVVRVEVRYEQPPGEFRDLWLIRFGAAGRCAAFEEWPYAPGQQVGGRD